MTNKISKEVRTACAVGMGTALGMAECIKIIESGRPSGPKLLIIFQHIRQLIYAMVSRDATLAFMEQEDQAILPLKTDDKLLIYVGNYLTKLQVNVKNNLAEINKFFTGFDLENLTEELTALQQRRINQILQLVLCYVKFMEEIWSKDWHSSELAAYIRDVKVYDAEFVTQLLHPMLKQYRYGAECAPLRVSYNLNIPMNSLSISLEHISDPCNIFFDNLIKELEDITRLDQVHIHGAKFTTKDDHVISTLLDILKPIKMLRMYITFDDKPNGSVRMPLQPIEIRRLSAIECDLLMSLTAQLVFKIQAEIKSISYADGMEFPELLSAKGRSMLKIFVRQNSFQEHALRFQLPMAQDIKRFPTEAITLEDEGVTSPKRCKFDT